MLVARDLAAYRARLYLAIGMQLSQLSFAPKQLGSGGEGGEEMLCRRSWADADEGATYGATAAFLE
eukprot:6240737-Pyramimonas_sp.AAC.1